MNISLRAGALLASLAFAASGCDPNEPKSEGPPKPEAHDESKLGPPAPEPAVVPSPIPSLPMPSNSGKAAEEKKDEAKPAEPKLEPAPPK